MALAVVMTLAFPGSSNAAAKGHYKFTIRAAKSTVVLGKTATVSGTVSHARTGSSLMMQQRHGKKWTNLRHVKVGTGHTFKYAARPSTPGAATYRACAPADKSHLAGCSSSVTVQIYKWHYLTDLNEIDGESVYTGTSNINGSTYTKSLHDGYPGYGTTWIEYNVNRKCSTLTGTYGLSDNSATGSVSQIELLADGNSLYKRAFSLGQSEQVTTKLSGYLRIRFEIVKASRPYYAYGAVGSPKVLCQF